MYSSFHLHPTRVRYEPIQRPAPSWLASSLGHFRVPPGLCFKTRVSAQPLKWKSFFIKLIFTRKLVHLASFWKWRFLEQGSGLLVSAMHRYQSGKGSNPGMLKLLYAFFSQLHKLRLYGWGTSLKWCYTGQLILAQHRVAMLEQCCNNSKQYRYNVATLRCAKNRRCESSRVTLPLLSHSISVKNRSLPRTDLDSAPSIL